MRTKMIALVALVLARSSASLAQTPSPDVKFIADTLVVQADGRYEADPDLATLLSRFSRRIRISNKPMTKHRNPCRRSRKSLKRTA